MTRLREYQGVDPHFDTIARQYQDMVKVSCHMYCFSNVVITINKMVKELGHLLLQKLENMQWTIHQVEMDLNRLPSAWYNLSDSLNLVFLFFCSIICILIQDEWIWSLHCEWVLSFLYLLLCFTSNLRSSWNKKENFQNTGSGNLPGLNKFGPKSVSWTNFRIASLILKIRKA